MHQLIALFIISIIVLLSGSASAQEFEHGNQAMQLFDKQGFENPPKWVQLWVGFMMMTFIAGIFFVKNHMIARWVVGCMIAGMIFAIIAGRVFGMPYYSGFIALIHVVFWSPALYQLLSKRPFAGPRSAFSIWSAVITFVICFSFIFDIRDAVIYLSNVL